jgi:hypothetical protein
MNAHALQEEDEIFREDAEEKRRENDADFKPSEPTTYMNIHG